MSADANWILRLIEVLVWPTLIGGILIAFRSQWSDLLGRWQSIRVRHGSLRFEAEFVRALSVAPTDEQASADAREDEPGPVALDADPVVVVLTDWNLLSVRLQMAHTRRFGLEALTRSAKQQIGMLRDAGALSSSDAMALDALRRARNAIVFSRIDSESLSFKQATEFRREALRLMKALE